MKEGKCDHQKHTTKVAPNDLGLLLGRSFSWPRYTTCDLEVWVVVRL